MPLQIARPPVLDRSALAQLLEPPYTDPYVRWCGRGGAARLPPIPIDESMPTTRGPHLGMPFDEIIMILEDQESESCIGSFQPDKPHFWLPKGSVAIEMTVATPR